MTAPLFKTTIVIWSRENGAKLELSALAREAGTGNAYCSRFRSELVQEPEKDNDWDGTEFFDKGSLGTTDESQ